jgi:hypothetical protein
MIPFSPSRFETPNGWAAQLRAAPLLPEGTRTCGARRRLTAGPEARFSGGLRLRSAARQLQQLVRQPAVRPRAPPCDGFRREKQSLRDACDAKLRPESTADTIRCTTRLAYGGASLLMGSQQSPNARLRDSRWARPKLGLVRHARPPSLPRSHPQVRAGCRYWRLRTTDDGPAIGLVAALPDPHARRRTDRALSYVAQGADDL